MCDRIRGADKNKIVFSLFCFFWLSRFQKNHGYEPQGRVQDLNSAASSGVFTLRLRRDCSINKFFITSFKNFSLTNKCMLTGIIVHSNLFYPDAENQYNKQNTLFMFVKPESSKTKTGTIRITWVKLLIPSQLLTAFFHVLYPWPWEHK